MPFASAMSACSAEPGSGGCHRNARPAVPTGRAHPASAARCPAALLRGTGPAAGLGSVTGLLHQAQERLGLAQGVGGGADVDALGGGGLGGGGHLAGGAVAGGHLGVHGDRRVGRLRLEAGVAVEVVELGRVGGVHLVLDHEEVGGGGGRAGDVAAQVPVVQVLTGHLRAGRAGDQAQVAAGGLDDLEPVGVGELAELLHVQRRVLLLIDRCLGPVLQVVHDPAIRRGDRVAGNVGGELRVGAVCQHAGGGESVAHRGRGRERPGGKGAGRVEEMAGDGRRKLVELVDVPPGHDPVAGGGGGGRCRAEGGGGDARGGHAGDGGGQAGDALLDRAGGGKWAGGHDYPLRTAFRLLTSCTN